MHTLVIRGTVQSHKNKCHLAFVSFDLAWCGRGTLPCVFAGDVFNKRLFFQLKTLCAVNCFYWQRCSSLLLLLLFLFIFQRSCWQLLFVKWSDLFVVIMRRSVKTFSLYFFCAPNLFLLQRNSGICQEYIFGIPSSTWSGGFPAHTPF